MTSELFGNLLRIFGGHELAPEAYKALHDEVALLTLARATSTDADIQPVEVETVRRALSELTGKDHSAADIRVAARSEVYETAPLEKFLASAGRKLQARDRANLLRALAGVITSDATISSRETAFFNMAAQAMDATAAELVGLIPE